MSVGARSAAPESDRVPMRTRIAYAMPAFAMAVVGIPFYVYVPKFYTDVVGVDIGTMGVILLLMRIFDGVIDPFIGGASDRTQSRWGRRRTWMLYGLAPFVVSLLATFIPPTGMSPFSAALWFTACMFAVSLFWSMVQIPYESLGAELSFDFDERTSILGLRDGLLVVGTVFAAAAPAVVAMAFGLGDDADAEREKFRLVALFFTPVLILACGWCIAGVRENLRAQSRQRAREESRQPAREESRQRAGEKSRQPAREESRQPAGDTNTQPSTNPWRAAGKLLGNRPFVLLLVSYTVTAIGSNLPATLIPYYVQYVIGDPDAEKFLLLYFVTGVLLLPFWIWLAKRIGKKEAWIASGLINAASFACVFFLDRGDSTAFAVLIVISGLGFGATQALPSSMQADVIDYEELRSGVRREGEIIGLWSVARKLAAALGVGLALPVLGLVGYVPNVQQSPEVIVTLKALYALVPAVLTIVGLLVAINYPISKRKHEAILDAIERRRAGDTSVPDPLAPTVDHPDADHPDADQPPTAPRPVAGPAA